MTSGEELLLPNWQQMDAGEFDIPGITRYAVDKVIVDGEVDGMERRAPLRMLVRVAFRGVKAPDPVFDDFRGALTDDSRYVDRVEKRYGYNPVIEGETAARARPSAIVNEQGIYSEEERRVVMELMESCTEAVFRELYRMSGPNIATLRVIGGVLKTAGIKPTHDVLGGFIAHMHRDPRFRPIGDGRIMLVGCAQDLLEIPPEAPRIDDFHALITSAIPNIITGPAGDFQFGAVLGTLKAKGTYVRQDQISELYEHLCLHPNVKVLDGGRYRITKVAKPVVVKPVLAKTETAPEKKLTLDAMIREVIGNNSSRAHKPRPKRRGGWKKFSNMDSYHH